jgi:hypothetical protein
MKVVHGTWSCSLNKINKGKIKVIVIPLYKHVVYMCFKGIAKSRICETPQLGYCKFCARSAPHNKGRGRITKPTHLIHVVHMGGPR